MNEHDLLNKKTLKKPRTQKKKKRKNISYEKRLRLIEKRYKKGGYKTVVAYRKAKTKASSKRI